MIEASNSIVASAGALRGVVEQASVSRSYASNPARVQEAASTNELPKAPYISPYISVNLDYDKAVLQIRDSDTGDVVQQFPSESRLAAQQRDLARDVVADDAGGLLLSDLPDAPIAGREVKQSSDVKSLDVVTVQQATSSVPANTVPQVAAAALSAGARTAGAGDASSGSVSVLA